MKRDPKCFPKTTTPVPTRFVGRDGAAALLPMSDYSRKSGRFLAAPVECLWSHDQLKQLTDRSNDVSECFHICVRSNRR